MVTYILLITKLFFLSSFSYISLQHLILYNISLSFLRLCSPLPVSQKENHFSIHTLNYRHFLSVYLLSKIFHLQKFHPQRHACGFEITVPGHESSQVLDLYFNCAINVSTCLFYLPIPLTPHIPCQRSPSLVCVSSCCSYFL